LGHFEINIYNDSRIMKMVCRKCGGPLPESHATGRPADYCSEGCRRAAAVEIRRLVRALERLTDRTTDIRLALRANDHMLWGLTPPEDALAATESEIAATELRL